MFAKLARSCRTLPIGQHYPNKQRHSLDSPFTLDCETRLHRDSHATWIPCRRIVPASFLRFPTVERQVQGVVQLCG